MLVLAADCPLTGALVSAVSLAVAAPFSELPEPAWEAAEPAEPLVSIWVAAAEVPVCCPPSEVLVSFDGQVGTTIQPGERLLTKRAERPVLLIRLGAEGFFARMRKKLQWGDLSDRERK